MVVVVPAVLVLAAVVSWPQYRQQSLPVSAVDTPAVGHWEETELTEANRFRTENAVDCDRVIRPTSRSSARTLSAEPYSRRPWPWHHRALTAQVYGPLAEDPLTVSSTDPQLPAITPPATRRELDAAHGHGDRTP